MRPSDEDPFQQISLLPEAVRIDLLDFLFGNAKDLGKAPDAEENYILSVASLHRHSGKQFTG